MAISRTMFTLLAFVAIIAAGWAAPKEFFWVVALATAIVCGLGAIAHSIKTNPD